MEAIENVPPTVDRKRYMPHWRKASMDLIPESEWHNLYFNYYLENVNAPDPYLSECIKKAPSFRKMQMIRSGPNPPLWIDYYPVTGEFFDDGKTAYSYEVAVHQDLVKAEGKTKEDVVAHYKISKIEDEPKALAVAVYTIDMEKAKPLVTYILRTDIPDDVKLMILEVDDLYNPYKEPTEKYNGTLGGYRQTLEGESTESAK